MKVTHPAVEIDFEDGFGLEVHGDRVMLKVKTDECPATHTTWVGGQELVEGAWWCGRELRVQGTTILFNGDTIEVIMTNGESVEMSVEEFLARLTRKEAQ